MVKLKRITSANSEEYAYVEKLLTSSFPLEEYRNLKQWKEFTDNNKLFNNNIILDNDKMVGLMTIWDLETFYYIEHFAIDQNLRSKGYGSKVLNILEKEVDKPIILEVEIPDNKTACRRIEFYQKYNFTLWMGEYAQPPYRVTETALPMKLMCRGELTEKEHFKSVVKDLYGKVYSLT